MYKFHYSPPPWGGGNEIQPKKFGEEIQGKKEEKGGKKKKKGKKKKGKEWGKEKKRKRKERGKKKVEIGEETLLKFAGFPLGKFLKINIYLNQKFGSFREGREALL